MKHIVYSLFLFAFLLFASCRKFLAEDPKSFISEDQFYKTQDDALAAVNAVYFMLNSGGTSVQTPYNTLFNTGMDMADDDEDPGPGATNPDVRSLSVLAQSSTNLRIYEIWQQHYAAIKKANVAIARLPSIDFDTLLKNRLIHEAKFLRALYYFNLVRLYGGVPLITEDQEYIDAGDYAIARSSARDVYTQIEKDLTEAAAVLPTGYSGTDMGRATAGAAKALLTKVYLTEASLPLKITSKYADAVKMAEQVLSPEDGGTGQYGYNLFQDYGQVFLPAYKNGAEHIFSAQFKSNSLGQGNNEAARTILSGVPGLKGSYAHMVRFYKKGNDNYFSVYKLFQPGDKRRDITFVRYFTSPTNGKKYGLPLNNLAVPNDSTPFYNKMWDPDMVSTPGESATNVAIIRYPDVLLMHAEAENELNGPTAKAYQSINRVRSRAGLPALPQGLNKDQFRDSVYLDRRLELVFEYQRWFDLIREKDASGNGLLVKSLHEAGKTNASEKHYLYPIPQSEIDNNELLKGHQNPGWE